MTTCKLVLCGVGRKGASDHNCGSKGKMSGAAP